MTRSRPDFAIRQFPCLQDNYGFLIHEPASGETVTIDTPDPEVILAEAAAAGWRITQIWNTHWHQDHAGGNARIKAETGAIVIGPEEVSRMGGGPDRIVHEGDRVTIGPHQAHVLDVGGHTIGHIAYWFPGQTVAFVGDALFALGCGRLFEGTPEQMWRSLSKLAALPGETTVYCAHEYTQSNARFALSVDGRNPELLKRAREIEAARAAGQPTVPTTIELERATNPFLRAPLLRQGLDVSSDVEAFAELRRRKDVF